ncbi:interactor of constitutive active ROPs 4-like [Dioscorea cayenensis subsp. rotundata]|uniref:Interactor of constitutive active ROPs 4-like n=1 Tax=Dioscorea cayennensis subsp. rotundata TaxID=55577 RepID=A0AB40AZC6_DIOCR|nr:interactor of constitutive active ROPs 4-like [Dioscorea cayenensis subsp. rotundata]XP_039120367.1 interactor of constitutive active ROPs 4-like [Dioscorea cayenensis subsp. rotundata]
MPRSRGTEMPQKQSPRAPLHLKTTVCSENNSTHRTKPRSDDRRSPRSPLHEKKRGTKVSDLETKLSNAEEELKKLREQLASAEAEKELAQVQLKEAMKQVQSTPEKSVNQHKEFVEEQSEGENLNICTTDVFEVVSESSIPAELVGEVQKEKENPDFVKDEEMMKTVVEEDEKVGDHEKQELLELRNKLAEAEKIVENLSMENENLKLQITEVAADVKAAHVKEEELGVKLSSMGEELKEIISKAEKLKEQLETTEKGKSALEAEMRRLKIQTEQWRKAAETAAAVLANDDGMMVEVNGRRVAERCGSMEKHFGGFVAAMDSPVITGDDDEAFAAGKRKSSGMKMFGDLWKKKGQNK